MEKQNMFIKIMENSNHQTAKHENVLNKLHKIKQKNSKRNN